MKIWIGVLTYNRPDYLKRLLESDAFKASVIKHQARVVVMAHATNKETKNYLEDARFLWHEDVFTAWESWQDLDLVTTRVRLCDRIIGMGLKPDDILIFIDDDAMVTDEAWIDRYLAPFTDDPKVGIVGQEAFNVNEDWRFFHPAIVPGEADVSSSSVMAMRGAVLLGGCEFDLIFGPVWHEDSDFCLQAKNAGWKVWGLDRKTTGVEHDSYRRTMDVIFQRNLEFLAGKWQGKGLVKLEQEEETPLTPPPNPLPGSGEGEEETPTPIPSPGAGGREREAAQALMDAAVEYMNAEGEHG